MFAVLLKPVTLWTLQVLEYRELDHPRCVCWAPLQGRLGQTSLGRSNGEPGRAFRRGQGQEHGENKVVTGLKWPWNPIKARSVLHSAFDHQSMISSQWTQLHDWPLRASDKVSFPQFQIWSTLIRWRYHTKWDIISVTSQWAPCASQISSIASVFSAVCSSAHEKQHQSSALLTFVREIHRWPVDSLHKGPVTRKMLPFDDVIMSCCIVTWLDR